jgi:hypothetical protein
MKKSIILMFGIFLVVCQSCSFFNKDSSKDIAEIEPEATIELTHEATAPDGTFSIMFPGIPEFSSEAIETEVGMLDNYMYIYEHSYALAYMVAYTDYPEQYLEGEDSQELLNNAMYGFIEEIGSEPEKTNNITLDKHPGLEFTASGNGYWAHMRDYLVHNRLYQIGILSSSEKVNEGDALAFFKSFILKN